MFEHSTLNVKTRIIYLTYILLVNGETEIMNGAKTQFFWSDIVRDCNLKGAVVNCTQCATINEPSIGRLYNTV